MSGPPQTNPNRQRSGTASDVKSSSMSQVRRPALAASILALVLVTASTAASAGFLDDIQTFYQTATFGWMDAALNVARSIFVALVGLEVVFTLAELLFRQRNLADYVGALTFKLISIGIAVTLLTLAPTWIPTILSDFSRMGNYIGEGGGTVNALTPSGIIQIGQTLCVTLWHTFVQNPNVVEKGLGVVPVAFSMVMLLLGLGALAMQFLLTMIEAYIILGGTAFLLGFTGSRWTMPWAERYFGMLVVMAIKVLVVSLLAAFAVRVGAEINGMIMVKGGASLIVPDYLIIGVSALIYGVIAWSAPVFVAKLMGTAPALQFSNVLRTVAGGAQIAGGAAATVASGFSSAGSAIGGAVASNGTQNSIRSAAAVD